MNRLLFCILILPFLFSCEQENKDYLVKYADENSGDFEYRNSVGEVIIPAGKYDYSFTDTIRDFGIVVEKGSGKFMGIDSKGTALFEVFRYDNGPDYIRSGLFRIVKEGKIGYANEQGEIAIAPTFSCAHPFDGGFALVADECSTIQDGDHSSWTSDNWYQIDKKGKRLE